MNISIPKINQQYLSFKKSELKQPISTNLEKSPHSDTFELSIGYVNDLHGQTNNMMRILSGLKGDLRLSAGDNDIGDTYIEVHMGEQHMYYYKNGYNIFESDFVSGDITVGDHATPEGIYQLYFKESPAILKGQPDENGKPEYETEVTYWMPFNGGIGFHDAEWQPYFGGDRFIGGGSHGCINLPYDAAATLFSIIDYGIPIICFY